MTIAQLFVRIGLISDTAGLARIDSKLKSTAVTAQKFAFGVGIVDAALIALMKSTLNVAVSFTKFRIQTGLSADELQRWQYAARLANVAGDDVANTVRTIQDAQAAIALGGGNIAPWQLLGIDPRQDPFAVLQKIHERIQGLNPAIARHITSQMGISDDMFQFLRRESLSLDQIQKKWMMTEEQTADMMALNEQWQAFTQHLEQVAMQFAMSVAPAFERMIPAVEQLLDKASRSLTWLMSADPKAMKIRERIVSLTEAVLIAAPALAALAKVLTAVSTALMAVAVARKAAAVKGLCRIAGRNIPKLAGLAGGIAGGTVTNEFRKQLTDAYPDLGQHLYIGRNKREFLEQQAAKTVTVTQNNTLHVVGGEAKATADATVDALNRQLGVAHDQAAQAGY